MILRVTIIAIILASSTSTLAGDFSYSNYNNDIKRISQNILETCKKNGIGSTLDRHHFIKTCGIALRGRSYRNVDNTQIYYSREKLDNGWRDVIGIENRYNNNDKEYSLVRSTITEIFQPHNQTEKTNTYADASLFIKKQGKWRKAWKFVNPITKEWNRANPLFPKQQGLTKDQANFYEMVWRKHVVLGTSKLVHNLKDARVNTIFN